LNLFKTKKSENLYESRFSGDNEIQRILGNGRKIKMRKVRKRSFAQLLHENKQELLNDKEALDKLEERLEARMSREEG
jgi:Fur-regulated basic protein B